MATECNCSFRTKLVGDGCESCNPEYALQMARDRIAGLESMLIRLRDSGGWYSSALEFESYEGEELYQEVVALIGPAEEVPMPLPPIKPPKIDWIAEAFQNHAKPK